MRTEPIAAQITGPNCNLVPVFEARLVNPPAYLTSYAPPLLTSLERCGRQQAKHNIMELKEPGLPPPLVLNKASLCAYKTDASGLFMTAKMRSPEHGEM